MSRLTEKLVAAFRSARKSTAAAPAARACAVEPLESRTLMSASPVLYTADGSGRLFTLNPDTGATHVIGRMPAVMYDIAFDKSGHLYGVSDNSVLYRINPTNATATRVGSLGQFANALTFAPNGTLYAAGHNQLLRISTTTGHATVVGNLGNNQSAGDLAFDSAGHLFLTTTADKLLRVNPTNGQTTVIGSIGFHEVYGLGFYNGVLYGVSNTTEQSFRINPTNAHASNVHFFGQNVDGAYGAAFRI